MSRIRLLILFIINAGLVFAGDYSHTARNLSDGLDSSGSATLLEILPLMEEVHSMEFIHSGGRTVLDGEDLAEYWGEAVLSSRGGNLELVFRGVAYSGLERLEYRGTPLDSRELEVWLSWEGVEELKSLLAWFADRHGIEINAVEVPSPDSKLVSVTRARGNVPDLVMLQSSAVDRLVRNRAVQALDYLELPELNRSGLEAFSLDGRLWAVPFYFDTQVFMFNPELTAAPAAEPWYLEDFGSSTYGSRAEVTMAWNAYSSNWLIPFQVSFGKDRLIDADGGITMDDEPTRKALSYVLDLRDRDLLVPMERDAMDARFIAGDVALIMTGSYSIPYFESLGIPFGVLPFPGNMETGEPVSPLLDYKAFCITRRTDSPILARRVMQYLVGGKVQRSYCGPLAKLPARIGALSDVGSEAPYLEVLESAAEYGTVIPPQQVYSVYKNTMWKLLRFALSGQMSVEETLERGQTLMDNSIEK